MLLSAAIERATRKEVASEARERKREMLDIALAFASLQPSSLPSFAPRLASPVASVPGGGVVVLDAVGAKQGGVWDG